MESRAFKTAAYAHLAEVGRALGNPIRVEILELITQAPLGVDQIASAVGQSVANASQHLQVLRRARLVRRVKHGQRAVYSSAGEDVSRLVASLHRVTAAHSPALELLVRDQFERAALPAEELVRGLRQGALTLVDVRPRAEFEAGHLPGAFSLPLDELEDRFEDLPLDRPVVAYCRGPFCGFAAEAVERLRAHGYDAHRAEVSVHFWPGTVA